MPVDEPGLQGSEKDKYERLILWFQSVDKHDERTAEWVKPVLDSFWLGGARNYRDLCGFSRSGIEKLPEAPQQLKEAFAWRAVMAAEASDTASRRSVPLERAPETPSGNQPIIVAGGWSQRAAIG